MHEGLCGKGGYAVPATGHRNGPALEHALTGVGHGHIWESVGEETAINLPHDPLVIELQLIIGPTFHLRTK